MSLPHIVVVVTRTKASSGPISGIGFSRSSIRPRSTNTAAFMVFDVIFRLSFGCLLAFGIVEAQDLVVLGLAERKEETPKPRLWRECSQCKVFGKRTISLYS